MKLELEGRRAVVTGGSRGIGLATAKTFVREGATVTIVSTNENSLSRAVDDIKAATGTHVAAVRADLSQQDERAKLKVLLAETDILINNAGAVPGGGFDLLDFDKLRTAFDLKVFGYVELTRLALEPMMARGSGVIVNVIGMSAVNPRYDYMGGAISNSAVANFTKAVGGHSTRSGVRVLAMSPGVTETDRLEPLYRQRAKAKLGDADRWREMLQQLPFGRPASAQEMADVIVFLASARASYLSGVVVDADAGAVHRTL